MGEDAQKNAVLSNNTIETSPKMGRITSLLKDGSLFSDLSHTDFSAIDDRAMVCQSTGLNTDMKRILEILACVKVKIQIQIIMSQNKLL